jgi:hypothetical protein
VVGGRVAEAKDVGRVVEVVGVAVFGVEGAWLLGNGVVG